jgi:hypothetical protein
MTMTRQRELAETLPLPVATTSRYRPHVSDVLLPVALCLWGAGVTLTHPAHLGSYGLPQALPPTLYAGLAVAVLSAVVELGQRRCSTPRLACHAVALVVMLYGIAPLIYADGRYEWLYKTIGPVQYISAKGQLNRSIDIYQNWPGFFALASWFDKVAGVASPLAYVKWAQLAFELAALPLLYLNYSALALTHRQRWIAIFLYFASNWIGQDYFSPQALGTVLSLGIMAIALRWMYAGNLPAREYPGSPDARSRPRGAAGARFLRRSRLWGPLCALLLCYFVLVYTHELSPYMLAVQLGMLAIFRLIKPRWLPLILMAIAVAYLGPRLAFVNSHYGLLSSIGDFFSNAAPPAFSATSIPVGQHFIERCAEALSLGIWVLAAVAAWHYRRAGKAVLALVLLAYSPVLLLGLQAYGHEGILRVYLFSLPWSAALVAHILSPSRVRQAEPHLRRSPFGRLAARPIFVGLAAVRASVRTVIRRSRTALRLTSRQLSALGTTVVIGAALALFFPAFYGDDSFNDIPATEVSAVTSFWLQAQPGPVYLAIDDAPVADTWRYNLFPLRIIFGSDGLMASTAITPSIASTLASVAAASDSGRHSYVMITSSMEAYTTAYGEATPHDYAILRASLAHSSAWALVLHAPGVVIYELRSATGSARS